MPEIRALLATNNLVLQAEPGAGKSTALPLNLLNAEWLAGKKILMLEPRRVAAKSIAHYLAQQLGESVGQRIGYQIKNDRKLSSDTMLEIVTEGILTRRLQSRPELDDIGLVIFDEFHERSIHADVSLMLCLEIQQTIREDLKLLLMSATMDTQRVSTYMGGAKILECPGRAFPVSVAYAGASKAPLSRQVTHALNSALASTDGDILVFLPGQADINRCISECKAVLGRYEKLRLLPLYGGLSLSQQEKALRPDPEGKQRIVFTTNIAETSLTIEGVSCVVDSGLEKKLVYDPASGMTRLDTTNISKASAEQRKGRAGRTQAGTCVRLWDELRQRTLRDYQGEEILSSDLASLVLELSIWGAGNYGDIHWLTPPPLAHYIAAQETLVSLGLMDSHNKVTALGRKVAGIGLPPRLATMLVQAQDRVEKGIACELAALLADRDIFSQNKGVDIVARLLALQDYKSEPNRALKNHSIHRAAMEQLRTSISALEKIVDIKKPRADVYSLSQLQYAIGKLLLYAYPDRLAKKRSKHQGRYQLANGKGVFLFDDDPLFGAEWLVVADCDGQKKEGRIYSAASITFESVMDSLGDKFVEQEQFEFDRSKQKITGQRVTTFAAIKIKSMPISDIPADKFQQCLVQILQQSGLDILNWTPQCDTWLARAQWLGEHMDVFPKLSKNTLQKTMDKWLFPYLSKIKVIADLKKIDVHDLLLGLLSWDEQQILAREAPTEYKTPSNKRVPIAYDSDQGPTVSVQLQEMFGEISSPKIAQGRVAIRFELLSPARRPIQTTSDLGNFWENSYFDVAKEMKGRYPRHRWPDKPLLEKAGRSIKSKR